MDKNTAIPASFVGRSGKFYVRQSRADGSGYHHRTTVWPTVEHYNERKPASLSFIDVAEALADFSYELTINPDTLTTNWAADKDETDLGLTPARNLWQTRFNQAKEGRAHAA